MVVFFHRFGFYQIYSFLAMNSQHTPHHDIPLPPIYWNDTVPCPKCRHVAITRGLFLLVALTCHRAPPVTRVVPVNSPPSDHSDRHDPSSIPLVRGPHAPLQRRGLAIPPMHICHSDASLSELLLSLTGDLVKEIKDLTNKYLKAFNYSASACTAGLTFKTSFKTRTSESQENYLKATQAKDEHQVIDEDEEHGLTLCGSCAESYASDAFWICCDICEKWFHGKCVKVTPERAEHIKQYECPSCSNKNSRP